MNIREKIDILTEAYRVQKDFLDILSLTRGYMYSEKTNNK